MRCRFKLDSRRKFSTMRLVKYWDGLLKDVVEASSLVTFNIRLDVALCNLI